MLVEGFGWGLPVEGLSGPVGARNSVEGALLHPPASPRVNTATTPNNTTDHPLLLGLIRATRCDGLINEYKHAA